MQKCFLRKGGQNEKVPIPCFCFLGKTLPFNILCQIVLEDLKLTLASNFVMNQSQIEGANQHLTIFPFLLKQPFFAYNLLILVQEHQNLP